LEDVPVSTSYWLYGKCAKINLSQAAFGMTVQDLMRLPVSNFRVKIAALGPRRGFSKDFQRSKLKL
jgi:hypothetical protein